MIDLLSSTEIPSESAPPEGSVGYLEFQVSKKTAPYLVTSSKALVWTPNPGKKGIVRAAYREHSSPTVIYREIFWSIYTVGRDFQWGNIFSEEVAANEYITGYDVGPVVLIEEAPWLPKGFSVVVPQDRGFLGTICKVNETAYAAIVHNAARGMAIIQHAREGAEGE